MALRQAPAKRQRVWGVRLVNGQLVTRVEGPANIHKFGGQDVKLDDSSKTFAAILENLLVLDKRRREESRDLLIIITDLKREVRNSLCTCGHRQADRHTHTQHEILSH